MIDVSKCKYSRKTKKDKFVECEACGMYFLYDKKGRKPKTCLWYKDKLNKETKKQKIEKEKAKEKGDFIAVPNLKEINSIDGLKKGMLVYHVSNLVSDETTKQKYSAEYEILEVHEEENELTVVRNIKSAYKNYPIKTSFSSFFMKDGYKYLRKENQYE